MGQFEVCFEYNLKMIGYSKVAHLKVNFEVT